jgi:hypothetical protein
VTGWRVIPAQKGLEHGDQLGDILGRKYTVDTVVSDAGKRRVGFYPVSTDTFK